MTELEASYQRILERTVAPLMRERGYRRIKDSWFFKIDGDCVKRLSCHLRKRSGFGGARFEIFVCVGFRSLAEFLSKWPGAHIKDLQRPCAMATDIGHLMPEKGKQYFSWLLDSCSHESIAAEIRNAIDVYGIPFLDKYSSMPACVEAWSRGETYNLGYSA